MTDVDKLKSSARFVSRLLDAINAPLSHAALGIFVRIADNDDQRVTARSLATRSPVEDERMVLIALRELEQAGFVRLRRVKAHDGTWTSASRVVFSPG